MRVCCEYHEYMSLVHGKSRPDPCRTSVGSGDTERLLLMICDEVQGNLVDSAFGPKITTLPWEVAQWYTARTGRQPR